MTLLSKADPDRPSGTPGGKSELVGISADGRYVAFFSRADNLLAGVSDANLGNDLFLHDRIADTTVLVSHAAGDPSTTSNAEVLNAALSANGRWVVYGSVASNLVVGQMDEAPTSGSLSAPDIFLWDRDSGLTGLVNHEAGLPTTAAGDSVPLNGLGISADGSRIAFFSRAQSLVPGQSGGSLNAFLYDRATDINALVSHAHGSATTGAGAVELALSADGNWVTFVSMGTGIVAGQVDANGSGDLFLYDGATGSNILVSHAAGSAVTACNVGTPLFSTMGPQISVDGSWISYTSAATNLAAGQTDGNAAFDVFLYDRSAGTNVLVSHASSSATTAGNEGAGAPMLSADGRYVAFESSSSDLVAASPSPWWDIFVYDRVTGTNTLVSRPGTTFANGFPSRFQISSDGAWIAFSSTATNLVSGQIDTLGTDDAFVWSRASGSISLVSHAAGSAATSAGGLIWGLGLSADGSWIALSSDAEKLVDGIEDHNAKES